MRKTLFFIITSLLLTSVAFAQNDADSTKTGWKKSLIFDLTTTQTAYSDSWTGGESGSMNWVSNLNGSAEKQLTDKFDIRSTLKLSFGQTITQDTAKNWSKPRKSTDLIEFDNVGRFTMGWIVDPFVGFKLESQFVDASVNAKKRYLSPMILTESIGLAKKFYSKDADIVTSRLGFAVRQILKEVIIDSLTLATEDSTYNDGGLESVTEAKLSLSERVSYSGKLTLYKAFFFSKSDDVIGTPFEDNWKAIDVNWENILAAQVSKILTVNLYTQILYDKEISKKGRFKETIGLGIVYKFL